jgi:hypothetical protein
MRAPVETHARVQPIAKRGRLVIRSQSIESKLRLESQDDSASPGGCRHKPTGGGSHSSRH